MHYLMILCTTVRYVRTEKIARPGTVDLCIDVMRPYTVYPPYMLSYSAAISCRKKATHVDVVKVTSDERTNQR